MYPYIKLHDKRTKKPVSIDVHQIKSFSDNIVVLYDWSEYEVLEKHDFIEKMLDATYKQVGTENQMGGTQEQDAQARIDELNAKFDRAHETVDKFITLAGLTEQAELEGLYEEANESSEE